MQVSKIESGILRNTDVNIDRWKLIGKDSWWDNIIWCLFIYPFIRFLLTNHIHTIMNEIAKHI